MSDGTKQDHANVTTPIVTADQFAKVDFQSPIVDVNLSDVDGLGDVFRAQAKAAEEKGDADALAVFSLLHGLAAISLNTEDPGDVWGPYIRTRAGRSAIPADFRGEQTDILDGLCADIAHPALRARLADLVWSNDRRKGAAAKVAIDAYCECAERLLSGAFKPHYEDDKRASFDAVHVVRRALQLAYATTKKRVIPDRVRAVFAALLEAARSEEGAFVVFLRTAETGRYYELLTPAELAPMAEELAARTDGKAYTMPIQALWELAAHQYGLVDDEVGRQRCLKGALDQILIQRDQIGSAGAKAHWTMEALQAMRHIKGVEDRELELERELRALQKDALKEMGRFSSKMDISGEVKIVVEAFDGFGLPEALMHFSNLTQSRPVDELRAEALKSLKQAPLSAMFEVGHMDKEGKTISKSPGASMGDEPDEGWFRHKIGEIESFRRGHDAAAWIDPARATIDRNFTIAERHLMPIVANSSFVPREQAHIIALGFTRFFQGDMMSATHLLLPQLEPCVRHLLKLHGLDPVTRFDDGTEEEMNLSKMLERMAEPLTAFFGADLLSEIDMLFSVKPGPALRHQLSHGHISSGHCFHSDAIYANWLMYRLVVGFIPFEWEEKIGPAIAAER